MSAAAFFGPTPAAVRTMLAAGNTARWPEKIRFRAKVFVDRILREHADMVPVGHVHQEADRQGECAM